MTRYDDHINLYASLVAVFGTLSIIAVALRFAARRKTKAHYGADDWFALTALVGFLAFCGSVLWGAENGLGYNAKLLPFPQLVKYLKAAYVSDLLSPIPTGFGRFSVLALYSRLFSVHDRFRYAVRIIVALNAMWYIGCTFALIGSCSPVRAFWDKSIKGKCINLETFVIAAEIPDSLLDFIIILLPVGVMRKLRLPLRHKIPLTGIFILAGFVGVIGFVRIIITYRPENYNANAGFVWLIVQLGTAVICCCLPTYGPLLPRFETFMLLRTRLTSLLLTIRNRSRTSSAQNASPQGSGGTGTSTGETRHDPYINLGDGAADKSIMTKATAGTKNGIKSENFPMDAIRVDRSVDMV